MELDLEELAAIVELLAAADFTEFRYEKGDLRLAVSRGGPLSPEAVPVAAPAATTPAAAPVESGAASGNGTTPVATPAQSGAASGNATAGQTVDEGEVLVTSPMLGTLYRSPKPGEPPFVEIGDKVEADTVLCIVEVMKLMNSVPAGVVGEVTRVIAADGDLVEFEAPLFAIRPLP